MSDKFKYKTIAKSTTSDFRDRGSKFFGYAYPISTVDDTKKYLANLKKEHPKAVHHCFAYRLGTDGIQFRANDNGEPSGSAGKPILGQIDSAGLTNVFVVVVRYFGGTLLGVPGLINAYRTATFEALDKAEVIEKNVERQITVSFDYPVMNEVMQVIKQSDATVLKRNLQLFCEISAGIPLTNIDHVLELLSKIRGVEVKE